jgi:hypothetical protein
MFRAVVLALLAVPLFGWNEDPGLNVNSRYTVESIQVSGKWAARLTADLRHDIDSVVGQKLDHELLSQLATRIRRQLRATKVSVLTARGDVPEHVRVTFEVEGERQKKFDIDVPKLAYHSRQGWSSAVDGTVSIGQTDVAFGVVTDGDALVERYSGVRARVEHKSIGTDRVRLGFEVDSFHQQWNPSTLAASELSSNAPALYRARNNFQPTATFLLAEGITLSVGATFNQIEPELSGPPTEWANAAFAGLRLHRRWEDSYSNKHELDAGYSLRSATNFLNSDLVYTRQAFNARYALRHEHSYLDVAFVAGRIGGNAPLYERFVLGNAETLRGWNKYDLDPLGGDRVIHGSVEYRYRIFDVFYDAGAIWDRTTDRSGKHGIGFGLRTDGREGFLLAVAFPINAGRTDPVFIAGFSF